MSELFVEFKKNYILEEMANFIFAVTARKG